MDRKRTRASGDVALVFSTTHDAGLTMIHLLADDPGVLIKAMLHPQARAIWQGFDAQQSKRWNHNQMMLTCGADHRIPMERAVSQAWLAVVADPAAHGVTAEQVETCTAACLWHTTSHAHRHMVAHCEPASMAVPMIPRRLISWLQPHLHGRDADVAMVSAACDRGGDDDLLRKRVERLTADDRISLIKPLATHAPLSLSCYLACAMLDRNEVDAELGHAIASTSGWPTTIRNRAAACGGKALISLADHGLEAIASVPVGSISDADICQAVSRRDSCNADGRDMLELTGILRGIRSRQTPGSWLELIRSRLTPSPAMIIDALDPVGLALIDAAPTRTEAAEALMMTMDTAEARGLSMVLRMRVADQFGHVLRSIVLDPDVSDATCTALGKRCLAHLSSAQVAVPSDRWAASMMDAVVATGMLAEHKTHGVIAWTDICLNSAVSMTARSACTLMQTLFQESSSDGARPIATMASIVAADPAWNARCTAIAMHMVMQDQAPAALRHQAGRVLAALGAQRT